MAFSTEPTAGKAPNSGRRPWRLLAWLAAAGLLLLPLVAMRFTAEVNWSASDFLLAGMLLFLPLSLYELLVRRRTDWAYRGALAIALLASVLLLWSSLAVGITDGGGDRLYVLALALAAAGGLMARGRPAGMAWAMAATAVALVLAGVVSLAAGWVAAHNSTLQLLGITGFFAVLFLGSAVLFRKAGRSG